MKKKCIRPSSLPLFSAAPAEPEQLPPGQRASLRRRLLAMAVATLAALAILAARLAQFQFFG